MKEGDIVIRIEGEHNGMNVGDMGITTFHQGSSICLFEKHGTFADYKHRVATAEEASKFPRDTILRYWASIGKPLPEEPIYQIF